ncbi:lytic transglycosylase domain-containing protein [Streptomyces sp. NPDC090022]|uniref:lytic transglycosylase domain-containing protein n=1 Tax=Streptomyces sp. NPDC090022 TaxID=3365920 RepID=UPI0037F9B729
MKPLHRHLVNTSRKVLCTAALAASLTTAAVVTNTPTADAGEAEPTPDSPQANDRGNARLDLPDLVSDPPPGTGAGAGAGGAADSASGIPGTALDAYKRAAVSVEAALPTCKLPWELLAGIGRIESVHASGYGLKEDGYTEKPIRGPRLDGNGFAKILDTDKGEFDADAEYDRAVGPMQFIPSTWATWGADGNGDGKRDPNNIYDAALGAGLYLCAGDRNLSDPAQLDRAILSYNNSREYVNSVLGFMRKYQEGVAGVPNPPAGNYPTQPPTTTPTPPATTPPPYTPPVTQPTNPTNPTKPANPTTPPVEPSKPTPPPATVNGLQIVGESALRAEAGAVIPGNATVKALLSDGKPAANEIVIFAVEEDTTGGTAFAADGKDHVVARTDAQGIAAAPQLKAGAGEKGGSFTLRATLYGTREFSVKFTGTVTPKPVPRADTITRQGDKAPEAAAGASFKGIELLATAQGKPAAGTVVTAESVVKDADGKWVADKMGPFFKDKDGKEQRSLTLAPTGADGKIVLPELFVPETAVPGPYHLRVWTKDGAELVLVLNVTKAETPDPAPTTPPVPGTPTAPVATPSVKP